MDKSVNIQKQLVSVDLNQIRTHEHFWLRARFKDTLHKESLMRWLKNSNKPLDPLLLWQDKEDSDELIVLDGHYRLFAYKAHGWRHNVPAEIVTCDKRTALTLAVQGNNKTQLPWSSQERLNVAWRLVREPVDPPFSTKDTILLSGVSRTSVQSMRRRLKKLLADGREITGNWWRDRSDLYYEDEEITAMTDNQRRKAITELAKDLRELLDRRKHKDKPILRESEAIAEVLQEALGDRNLRYYYEYLYAEEDEGLEAWLEMNPDDLDDTDF